MDLYYLAEKLHEKQCSSNHIDGCSWYYETDPSYPTPTWSGWAHNRFYEKAQAVYAKLPDMTIFDIVKVLDVL